jgi:hypothetical protein
MTELYATACGEAIKFPDPAYNFDRAVVEFEQGSRLVDYFQYVITDLEFQRVIRIGQENATKAG